VATDGTTEWWWFRDNFYKVEFQEGEPSLALKADLEAGDTKHSLSKAPNADEEGYSPDEVAEGVFKMEGRTETGLQYADRMDAIHAVFERLTSPHVLRDSLRKQDTSRDYGVERDESARVFINRTVFSSQVLIESSVHRPPAVLVSNAKQFEVASKLQQYHPILIDKQVGRGRLWKSEIVAEWWWFEGGIYLAKRERGYQSDVLRAMKQKRELLHAYPSYTRQIPNTKSACIIGHHAEDAKARAAPGPGRVGETLP
jgi:hypothetical protein